MAGLNKTEILAAARLELKDNGTIWTDAQLGGYVDRVVKDISLKVPDPKEAELPIIDGTCDVDIFSESIETYLYALNLTDYVDCVPTDIGKMVTDDGDDTGNLIAYNNTSKKWWFESETPIVATSVMAITGGTGAGTAGDASVTARTGLVRVTDVEYPIGEVPRMFRNFTICGNILTIELDAVPPAGSTANVHLGKLHIIGDTSTLGAEYDNLLIEGTVTYAMLSESMYVTNKVNYSAGAMEEYMRMGQQRMALYRDALNRIGEITIGRTYPRE